MRTRSSPWLCTRSHNLNTGLHSLPVLCYHCYACKMRTRRLQVSVEIRFRPRKENSALMLQLRRCHRKQARLCLGSDSRDLNSGCTFPSSLFLTPTALLPSLSLLFPSGPSLPLTLFLVSEPLPISALCPTYLLLPSSPPSSLLLAYPVQRRHSDSEERRI